MTHSIQHYNRSVHLTPKVNPPSPPYAVPPCPTHLLLFISRCCLSIDVPPKVRICWHFVLDARAAERPLHVDGISVYSLNSVGIVRKHAIETIIVNGTPVKPPFAQAWINLPSWLGEGLQGGAVRAPGLSSSIGLAPFRARTGREGVDTLGVFGGGTGEDRAIRSNLVATTTAAVATPFPVAPLALLYASLSFAFLQNGGQILCALLISGSAVRELRSVAGLLPELSEVSLNPAPSSDGLEGKRLRAQGYRSAVGVGRGEGGGGGAGAEDVEKRSRVSSPSEGDWPSARHDAQNGDEGEQDTSNNNNNNDDSKENNENNDNNENNAKKKKKKSLWPILDTPWGCETSFDCSASQVCCDFVVVKFCCSNGIMQPLPGDVIPVYIPIPGRGRIELD